MFDDIKINDSRSAIMQKIFGFKLTRSYFCMYARNGIYWYSKNLLSANKIKNEALVPAFSCGDELYAIKKAGFSLKFYDHEDINVTTDIILDNISSKTGLVLLTHNFGVYNQNIKDISRILKINNIKIVEDCAYILGNNKLLAPFFSNCRVFSLRKHFLIPHGGLIQLSKNELPMKKFLSPNTEVVEKELFIYLSKKTGYLKSGIGLQSLYSDLSIKSEHPCGARGGLSGYNLDISNSSLLLLSNNKIRSEIALRKKRAKKIIKILSSVKNENFKIISKNLDCPTSFVFLKLNNINSSVVDRKIKKIGILCTQPFWSYLHDIVDWSLFADAKNKKNSILAVRLDIDISDNILYKIGKII